MTVCSAPVIEKAVMTGACGACSIILMVYLRVVVSVNLMVNVLAIEKSIESVNRGVTEMGVIPAGYSNSTLNLLPSLPSSGTMASTVYSASLNLVMVDWAFKSSPLVVSTLTFSTIYLERLVSITSAGSFLQDI